MTPCSCNGPGLCWTVGGGTTETRTKAFGSEGAKWWLDFMHTPKWGGSPRSTPPPRSVWPARAFGCHVQVDGGEIHLSRLIREEATGLAHRQPDPAYVWRGGFDNREVERLHAEAFDHAIRDYDWSAQLEKSLGWVTARSENRLVGFVNVAWDGGVHAFILDTMAAISHRRRGVATQLIERARAKAHEAGCEWLHVDFKDYLENFYWEVCGFRPTKAGLMDLTR